jgi:hypothetical protein
LRAASGRRVDFPVEFNATNSNLAGSPGCRNLFEISDPEAEVPVEVEAIDNIESGDEPLEPASRFVPSLA